MGPIATVPTILPNQLVGIGLGGVVNVTEAYNQTVKKLINHVPTSSAILRDSKGIFHFFRPISGQNILTNQKVGF